MVSWEEREEEDKARQEKKERSAAGRDLHQVLRMREKEKLQQNEIATDFLFAKERVAKEKRRRREEETRE